MALLTIEHLTKRFGTVTVLQDISCTVAPGESVALWGPNGAGKTTLLRCVLGVLPFEGTIRIDGLDVRRQGKQARRLVGFVPQEVTFYPTLTVGETAAFFARLRGLEPEEAWRRLAQVALEDRLDQPVRTLSGGQRQRLALALALLGDPPLLLLDEPTASLDVRSRAEFMAHLQTLLEQGKTLLFSTHRFEEVEHLARRVLLLENGRLEADTTPGELARRLFPETTHYRLRLHLPEAQRPEALQALRAHGFEVWMNGHGLEVRVPADEKATPLMLLSRAGFEVTDFELHV